jgi:hypothetical protein
MTSDLVMINPEQQRFVLMAIINGPRPRTTLRVWGVAMVHIQRDTGDITGLMYQPPPEQDGIRSIVPHRRGFRISR